MAGSTGGIRAGGAFVELFAKDGFSKTFNDFEKKFSSLGKSSVAIGTSLGAAGAALLTPLAYAATKFAAMGDAITKASQRTGVGAEQLETLKYAAEQSGASFEDLETGLKKMQKTLFDAAGGSQTAKDALAALGVTSDDLKGLTPDEQFRKLGDALNNISDPTAKAGAAMAVFGKADTGLIPLFSEGAAGILALQQRAEELGLTFSGKDAQAATAFGDILDDLNKQVAAVVFQVGSAVASALQPFAEALTHGLRTVIDFVKENKSLVLSVLAVGVGLVAAGGAFLAAGLAMQGVVAAAGGIAAAFGIIGTVLGVLLNPIVLVGVGLVGLAGYFVYTSQIGKEAITFLEDRFATLFTTAKETFGGIADALAAGDIGLAAQILWVGLQTAFIQGTKELQDVWANFKAGFVKVAADAFYGALELYQIVKAALETAFEETTAFLASTFEDATGFLGSLWDGFIGTFTNLWANAVGLISKGLNLIKGVFSDTFDSSAANDAIDETIAKNEQARKAAEAAAEAQREQQTAASKKQIESDRKTNVGQIQGDKEKALGDLAGKNQDINAAADQNAKDDIAATEKRKADLEKQLADLRSKAAGEKKTKDDEKPKDVKKPGADLDDVIAKQQDKTTFKAASTFNLSAIQSLRGGGMTTVEKNTERTAKAAEDTSRFTKKLVDKGGFSFGK